MENTNASTSDILEVLVILLSHYTPESFVMANRA